jgi:hypothetical protein
MKERSIREVIAHLRRRQELRGPYNAYPGRITLIPLE